MPFLKKIEELKIRQDLPEDLRIIILDFGYKPSQYATIAEWEWDMIVDRVYRQNKELILKTLNIYNFYMDLQDERARRGRRGRRKAGQE